MTEDLTFSSQSLLYKGAKNSVWKSPGFLRPEGLTGDRHVWCTCYVHGGDATNRFLL